MNGGFEELKDFLETEPGIDLTRVVDEQGYTLAHLATYHNNFPILKLLCSTVRLSIR